MLLLVKLVGILVIAIGIMSVLNLKKMKDLMSYIKKDKRINYIGVIRITFGVIFLLAAPSARLSGIIAGLGIVMIAAGLAIFILGIEKAKSVIDLWMKKSDVLLRLWAFIALLIGLLITYSA